MFPAGRPQEGFRQARPQGLPDSNPGNAAAETKFKEISEAHSAFC
jgi:DnaJ-class molecular chaperone